MDWGIRDWRIRGIIGVTIVSLIATGAVYYSGYGLDPATHFGAVFAAWVGGLALFLVAGSVVAIVSLVRPEDESFDSRARILFRRQAGKHIDYIVSKIKEVLEQYAESTTIKISIRDFDETEKKYRAASSSTVVVRSYLDDIETTYISSYNLRDVTTPPAKGAANRLIYTRVAGNPVGTTQDFVTEISRPISCRIEADGTCEVSSLVEFWVQANDEANAYTPRRYTQELTLEIENVIPSDRAVEVKLTFDGTNFITEQLAHGVSRKVLHLKDLKPGTMAFDYRIMAP
jgi:hypothetical protein